MTINQVLNNKKNIYVAIVKYPIFDEDELFVVHKKHDNYVTFDMYEIGYNDRLDFVSSSNKMNSVINEQWYYNFKNLNSDIQQYLTTEFKQPYLIKRIIKEQ